jgi:hypothetical protein
MDFYQTTQKIVHFIVTAVRTSNPTSKIIVLNNVSHYHQRALKHRKFFFQVSAMILT